MRLLFDDHIFAVQRYGGISRYFVELMREFDRMGGVDMSLPFPLVQNEHLLAAGRGRVRRFLGSRPIPRKDRMIRLLNRPFVSAALRRGRFDVFHATFTDRWYLDLAGRKPFVVTVHDMIPELFAHLFRDPTSKHPFKREAVAAATAVIAVSENTRQDLIRCTGVDPAKVHVIHHGIGDLATERAVADVALPDRFVLFVGLRWGYKNFDRFARAMVPVLRKDPGLSLLCVGAGPLSAAERAVFAEAGCLGRVHWMNLDDAGLAAAYRKAALFVYPSVYEGFGLPILESFAQGCPAALARASCFPEIAADAALYFDPDDEADMAATIERLLGDPALRADLAARGRRRLGDFSWRRTAERTHRLYRSLL